LLVAGLDSMSRLAARVFLWAAMALLALPAAAQGALVKYIQGGTGSTLIRAKPASWVLGSAFDGWRVDVQGGAVNGYRWGYVYNGFDRCAWVAEAALPAGGSSTSDKCPAPIEYPLNDFSYGIVGSNDPSSTGSDGAPTVFDYNHPGCNGQTTAYANTRPWVVPAQPRNPLFTMPNGLPVRWRYVTKDGQWVLIHDMRYDPAGGYPPNWYFVKRQCIDLPGDSSGPHVRAVGDYNGDGRSEIAVWRPSDGVWYVRGLFSVQWGARGDVPVPGDYNGDGRSEIAVWRPSDGVWYVRGLYNIQWGAPGDIPVPADYDGNGTTDLAVWRPSDGVWYVRGLFNRQWGTLGDLPAPADYNRDRRADTAVFRPSNGVWYVYGLFNVQWGATGDVPVPADYNRDGGTDLAVWRPGNGVWYVYGLFNLQWGAYGDDPVPGDFNGDGGAELAVWRPSNGVWYVYGLYNVQWGATGDVPVSGAVRYAP
jgi:hypothetical protein